jgi:hypothetical protein
MYRLFGILTILIGTAYAACGGSNGQTCSGVGTCNGFAGGFQCTCQDSSYYDTGCNSHRCQSTGFGSTIGPPGGPYCSTVGACVVWTGAPSSSFGYNYCQCDGFTQPFCMDPTCINVGFQYSPQVLGLPITAGSVNAQVAIFLGTPSSPIFGSPCSGLGLCSNDGTTCLCPRGMAMPWCVAYTCLPPGSATPCGGNGVCNAIPNPGVQPGGSYLIGSTCACANGWEAPTCEIWDCGLSIGNGLACNGTGTCSGYQTGAGSCACNLGSGGNICDTPTCTSPSVVGTCAGNGTCTSGVCTCGVNNCGSLCEVGCGGCGATGSTMCQCLATSTPDVYSGTTCVCKQGYGGQYCCPISPLTGTVCSDNACLPGGVCACPGTVGGNACSGFGTCNAITAYGTCTCNTVNDFTTPNCCPKAISSSGRSTECGGRGVCTGTGCQCNAGYSGEYCCPAGCNGANGVCTAGGCRCNTGFAGSACQFNTLCPATCNAGSGYGTCLTEPVEQNLQWYYSTQATPKAWHDYDDVLGFGGYDPTFTIQGVTFITPYANVLIKFAKGFYGIDLRTRNACNFNDYWANLKTQTETPYNPNTFGLQTPYPFPVNSTYDMLYQIAGGGYSCDSATNYIRVVSAQQAAGNVSVWATSLIQYYNPNAAMVDPGYLAAIVSNLSIPISPQCCSVNSFSPTQTSVDTTSAHVWAILNIWLYSRNVDPSTGADPVPMSFAPPRHCACTRQFVHPSAVSMSAGFNDDIRQTSPQSWQPDCSVSIFQSGFTGVYPARIANPVDCGGYQDGEFWGRYNPTSQQCVCNPHRSNPDCSQVLPDNCFDPTQGTTALACNGLSHGICIAAGTPGCDCVVAGNGPTKYTGRYCQYSVCSWNASTEIGRTTECGGNGICVPTYTCDPAMAPGGPFDQLGALSPGNTCYPTGTCTCDVAGELSLSDSTGSPPTLPVGPTCAVNAIAQCGIAVRISSTSAKVKWMQCNGNGICTLNTTASQYGCVCATGWTGPFCTIATCAVSGGCNSNQTCVTATSMCQCKPLYSTPVGCTSQTCACSVSPCVNGLPDAATGTTCNCYPNWVKNTAGRCTILQCPLTMLTDLGERVCTSLDPVCNSTQDSHRDKCCENSCKGGCVISGTTGLPTCNCNPPWVYQPIATQTDSVCHSICHGHGYTTRQGTGGTTISCQCSKSFFLYPLFNSTTDWLDSTCLRTTCQTGGVVNTLDNGCSCPNGTFGSSCSLFPPVSSSSSSALPSSSGTATTSTARSSVSSSSSGSPSSSSTGTGVTSTGVSSGSSGALACSSTSSSTVSSLSSSGLSSQSTSISSSGGPSVSLSSSSAAPSPSTGSVTVTSDVGSSSGSSSSSTGSNLMAVITSPGVDLALALGIPGGIAAAAVIVVVIIALCTRTAPVAGVALVSGYVPALDDMNEVELTS